MLHIIAITITKNYQNTRYESMTVTVLTPHSQSILVSRPDPKLLPPPVLPFQKGFRMSSVALRGLYSALRKEYGLTYLLTYRLNQDCVENFSHR